MNRDLFPPIAIVGRGCLLPGADSPEVFWQLCLGSQTAIRDADTAVWRVPDPATFLTDPAHPEPDKTWTTAGGYVVMPEEGDGETTAERWLLHCGKQALAEAGYADAATLPNAGLIAGNLSYPSDDHARFAEAVWQGIEPRDGTVRFSSVLPLQRAAQRLGCDRVGTFALDAACASSLYALRFACDRLQDGEADLMLAGGINAADPLFLNLGFAALGALSRSGKSRPFHRNADGLVPASGAVLFALRRLADARRDGQKILGVLRGIGLSNDGASGSLLKPATDGQVRAMRAAYEQAQLSPDVVSYVECHATGTAVGDRAELESLATVFAGRPEPLRVGSHKAHTGHLLTAAGAAGLLKVLAAFEAERLPPTPGVTPENASPAFDSAPARLIVEDETWSRDPESPRYAAVSAFGFGGNNAHLLVADGMGASDPEAPNDDLAVVAMGVRGAGGRSTTDFLHHLFFQPPTPVSLPNGAGEGFPAGPIMLPLADLKQPPQEAAERLGQQLLLESAADEAMRDAATVLSKIVPSRRVAFVGMGCDSETTRHGLRWRSGVDATAPLTAGRVKGTLPNMAANALCQRYDFQGLGVTVSAEEGSGLVALQQARRALARGEADIALVGATEIGCETVHHAASAILPAELRSPLGDAAVVLVVLRLADARQAGCDILAVLPGKSAVPQTAPPQTLTLGPGMPGLTARFGHAHAASGLLLVAAGIAACAYAALIPTDRSRLATPWMVSSWERRVEVMVSALGGQCYSLQIAAAEGAVRPVPTHTVLETYAASSRAELIESVAANDRRGSGPVRLAITAPDAPTAHQRRQAALDALRAGNDPLAIPGVAFADKPIGGETAFVFAGAAAGYPGMGRELLLTFPELWQSLASETRKMAHVAEVLCPASGQSLSLGEQITGSWAISQFHARFTRDILGIAPQATIGMSSGEVAALYALGAWSEPDALFDELAASGVQEVELGGQCRSVRRSWEESGAILPGEPIAYRVWHVRHPVDAVLNAVRDEPRVRVSMIFAPDECGICGQDADCRRVLQQLGAAAHPLGFDMAVHCPELAPSASTWHRLHSRPTRTVPGVRFYTNADHQARAITQAGFADDYTTQALHPIDLTQTVRNAYADGVRVFIEHGPRGSLSACIERTLSSDAERIVVPMDRAGRNSVLQALESAARLWCVGVADLSRLTQLLADRQVSDSKETDSSVRMVTLPVRLPELAIARPTSAAPMQVMPPAPFLAPVSGWNSVVATGDRGTEAPIQDRATLLQSTMHRDWLNRMSEGHRDFLHTARRLAPTMQSSSRQKSRQRGLSVSAPAGTVPASPRHAVSFSRHDLEILASGHLSDVFGAAFAEQDGYRVQVRMPMPPLLLADRVTRIDAEPGVLGKGSIHTETDVSKDAWYLHHGQMPLGLMIEAGQSDLLLISWMGVDRHLRGERAYRLLGCDLTFHGPLATPGETLRYAIEIEGHAQNGDIRLFFFRYDCYVGNDLRMSVRNGQAGFFTPDELRGTKGVLYEPIALPVDAPFDAPRIPLTRTHLTRADLERWTAGDAFGCFGKGFERFACHTRTPSPPPGRMLLLDAVTMIESGGGPYGRGYLRAEKRIAADDWYFAPHFQNDPCMPGTLMLEGCLQAMAVYLASLGYTADCDGWRFEPVRGSHLIMRCRGQVTPDSKLLVYELFVRAVQDGDMPRLVGDVLCSVDGVRAFLVRDLALALRPDWPAASEPTARLLGRSAARALCPHDATVRASATAGGVRGDEGAMIASAWGKPSDAFGPMYAAFDGGQTIPRLPGPPYLCMTRITQMPAEPGQMQAGVSTEAEFDLDPAAWYFRANGTPALPFAVLLEAALQPCGGLASFVGCAATAGQPVRFRNLDGKGTVLGEVRPTDTRIVTRATLTGLSRVGTTTITAFTVECFVDGRPLYRLQTVFGFFPPAALAEQIGLPADGAPDTAFMKKPMDGFGPLFLRRDRPEPFFTGTCRLPEGRLLLLDRVTGVWEEDGQIGLRAEMDVDPAAWFFRAHFFQDPVQPGSLGLEAMLQLLQVHLLRSGASVDIPHPRFEPIAPDTPHGWKYRGQVTPSNRLVTVTAVITESGRDDRSAWVVADASLWVDGLRIYEATGIGVRIVSDPPVLLATETVRREWEFDPAEHAWVRDHCPTHTLPSMPMMGIADLLAGEAVRLQPGKTVVALHDVQAMRWLLCDRPRRLRSEVRPTVLPEGVVPGKGGTAFMIRLCAIDGTPEEIATGTVILGDSWLPAPNAIPPLAEGVVQPNPYDGELFHGPAFRYLRAYTLAESGSSTLLEPSAGWVEPGILAPGLLDAGLHGIPHLSLDRWCPAVGPGQIGYPRRIRSMHFYGPAPVRGAVRCEARFTRMTESGSVEIVVEQVAPDGRVWVRFAVEEVCLPKGRIGSVPPALYIAFLRDRRYVPEISLSAQNKDGATVLDRREILLCDWLPGTVASAYGITNGDIARQVAVKEHFARLRHIHPSRVEYGDGESFARVGRARFPVTVRNEGMMVIVEAEVPNVSRRVYEDRFVREGNACGTD